MIIAITGPLGAGKTTAANYCKALGHIVINVDELGHEVLQRTSVKDKVVVKFGEDILDRTLNLNRKKVAEIVFNDPKKLEMLNEIVWPVLIQELKESLDKHAKEREKVICIDVALFEELGLRDKVAYVIYIQADIEKIYERLTPKYTKRQILNVLNVQKKPQKIDYEIENNRSEREFKEHIKRIITEITHPQKNEKNL